MDELSRLLEGAQDEVQVAWDEERTRAAAAGLRRRRRRRTVVRAGLLAALVAIGGGALIWVRGGKERAAPEPAGKAPAVARSTPDQPAPPAQDDSGAVGVIRLSDGSLARPLGPGGALDLLEESAEAVTIEVVRGGGRFEVATDEKRRFRVIAGPIEVEVIGTVFEVEIENRGVRVAVVSGRVRVRAEGVERWLAAGTAATFSTHWRAVARAGHNDDAYRALRLADSPTVVESAVVLMEAADAARLSGHPREAAEYLRQLLLQHPADPLAPLAAFTLGRLLLDRLGEPREAAEAFQQAGQLAPEGSLAQDALAREVEAWSKAGESGMARQRAEQYLERYPHGRRMKAVRVFGGLE